jgi:hypothetical protein
MTSLERAVTGVDDMDRCFDTCGRTQSRFLVMLLGTSAALVGPTTTMVADVNRIQADAELANARARQRLVSGRSLVESTKERNALP